MFTGIIEEVGRVLEISFKSGNKIFTIQSSFAPELKIGDSVAVEGCCLTVIGNKDNNFQVEATKETLNQTTLKDLKRGDFINLERAIMVGSRLGGHFVQGHIDEIGKIIKILREGRNFLFEIRVKNNQFLVEKGSVAVSGISLTVYGIKGNIFQVMIIPHTYENTTLKYKRVGSEVNVEYDILGKYAKR
ncbi:MAG: riboflavin synthase [candidate division WOR-3 bacterium]